MSYSFPLGAVPLSILAGVLCAVQPAALFPLFEALFGDGSLGVGFIADGLCLCVGGRDAPQTRSVTHSDSTPRTRRILRVGDWGGRQRASSISVEDVGLCVAKREDDDGHSGV